MITVLSMTEADKEKVRIAGGKRVREVFDADIQTHKASEKLRAL